MLVRNSKYKGGTGLPWASGPSGKTSYFSEESLVLMSQELSSQRPTACSDSKEWLPKFLFYKKVWGWLLAFCEVCRERQSMISALGVQTLTPSSHFQDTKSPVLSCTWGPPVTFHVTLSREYIFSLPECEKSKSSYRSMVLVYQSDNWTGSFKIRLLSLTLHVGISSNSWTSETQWCKSICYSTLPLTWNSVIPSLLS